MAATVIAIAGGTGSGKSTIAQALVHKLGPHAFLYTLDRDYKSLEHLHVQERSRVNYDHPNALDLDASFRALRSLKAGSQEVFLHTYLFETHGRGPRERVVIGGERMFQRPTGPTIHFSRLDYIVIEGLFALHPKIRPLVDLGVFLDVDLEECYRRRVERDTVERGRSLSSVNVQWNRTVVDGYRDWVLPSKDVADLVFATSDEISRLAIPKIFETIGANPGISYEWE